MQASVNQIFITQELVNLMPIAQIYVNHSYAEICHLGMCFWNSDNLTFLPKDRCQLGTKHHCVSHPGKQRGSCFTHAHCYGHQVLQCQSLGTDTKLLGTVSKKKGKKIEWNFP